MLTASELVTLKNKVENEMKRRCYYGSLTGFSGDSWEIQTVPTKNTPILTQQGKSVIEPILQITDYGDLNIEKLKPGELIPESFDSSLINHIDKLSGEDVYGNHSSCRGACTGLCVGTCGNTCDGCKGSCQGTCGTNCTTSCGVNCGSCSGVCSSKCSGLCTTTCTNSCTGCKSSCNSTCGANCKNLNT